MMLHPTYDKENTNGNITLTIKPPQWSNGLELVKILFKIFLTNTCQGSSFNTLQ
jgi:hypothetical protein